MRTWSFRSFPKYFDNQKKQFIFGIVTHFQEWVTQLGKGPIHPGAITTSGLEGEFTDKLKVKKTKDELNQNRYPCIHLQSVEEGEMFREFAHVTKNLYY